jgi:DNA-binding CsgD family transcriptional regulator
MDALIAAVPRGRASFVLVVGPAGIGKTRFLAAVERRARNAGLDVLRATGAEFERGFAFGGAVQLFEAPLRGASDQQRRRLLEGAARLGGVLLGFGSRRLTDSTGDGFAAFHGLYWLCVNFAGRSPLALLIDDAHWLDEQSLGWIDYLARRLESLPVVIVLATRPAEELSQRLTRTASETSGHLVELCPLSGNAVRDLMNDALDQPADAEFSAAFEEATGGNPFLVHELLRTVREERLAPDAAGARAVRTLGSDRIRRAVLLRLHRLSPASVQLARAIAILGTSRSLSVAARLAGLDNATAAQATGALVAADVLAPGPALRFQHPVVQASVYEDLPGPARALHHRQAARLLAETGASVSEVASQLLEAEPLHDSWTVDLLRSAALDASARGSPQAAIIFLERALAEPPRSHAAEVLFELGRAAYAALEIPKAIDALTGALQQAEPADRGRAALELARVLLHAGSAEEAVRLLKAELDASADVAAELRLSLQVEYVLFAGPLPEALPITRRFRTLEGRNATELAALGVASSMADTAREAAALAQRALAGGVLVRASDSQSAWFLAPWMLIRADHLEEVAAVIEEALDHSSSTGSQLGFARSSWLAAEVDYRTGDLLHAEAHARSAYEIASQGGSLWVRLMAGALLAQILADRGELAEAQELVDALDVSSLAPRERLIRTVRYARGYVALLAGHSQQSVVEFEHLEDSGRVAPAGRSRFATGMAPRAIALSTRGRKAEALEVAEEELAWAEDWGAPRFIGMALRARAHVLERAARIPALQAAVTLLERAPAGLELARALADLGFELRRDNQRVAAREPLRRALDLTRRCRADTLAEQLRGELRAAGAKPRRDLLTGTDSLTASESRIAQMAATGMTNPQIAQTIFLTPGTVEKHLTSVYAKLGISSRHQLPAALSADTPTPPQ